MKPRYYAFWKYDLPPYALGGEVLAFHNSGGVFIKGYDNHMTTFFLKQSLIAVMDYETGCQFQKALDMQKTIYDNFLQQANNVCKDFIDLLKTNPANTLNQTTSDENN